jgi:hypothetical protein
MSCEVIVADASAGWCCSSRDLHPCLHCLPAHLPPGDDGVGPGSVHPRGVAVDWCRRSGWTFICSALDSLDPNCGSSGLIGVGGTFVIWALRMGLGSAIMLIWNVRAAAFFRNQMPARGWVERHAPDISNDSGERNSQ